ncbi:nucleotidyltransferase domain-containing protein [Paenibacillus silvisoli]|uniref:nucleotidyltransferase domain-containing protein n=1 Tax=Paenibacillus silvisoli TaxID=3110539 RepID=UPI00280547CD|nr:nucleotidyltransferase domain-containing protein [Paenibacillus silvisoli]
MLLDYIIVNKGFILDIFDKHGASDILIIGSVSRREETEDSDIDFVVDMKTSYNTLLDLELTDVQAVSDLVKELQLYFKRNVEVALYSQIGDGYKEAKKIGYKLGR